VQEEGMGGGGGGRIAQKREILIGKVYKSAEILYGPE